MESIMSDQSAQPQILLDAERLLQEGRAALMARPDVDAERFNDADRAERLVEEHIRTAWARLRQPS